MGSTKVRRGIAGAGVVAAAALVAAGCGGGGGSGAAAAATESTALEMLPKDTIAYVTLDADLDGEAWKRFESSGSAFSEDAGDIEAELDKGFEEEDQDVTYADDIKPWIGDSVGFAMLGAPDGGESEGGDSEGGDDNAVAWADVADRAKLEGVLKDQDATEKGSEGDFELWEGLFGDDSVVAVSDDLALIAPSRDAVVKVIGTDGGDSVLDGGAGEVAGEAGGDAVATVVVNGDGIRSQLDDVDSPQSEAIGGSAYVERLDGFAASLIPEQEGMRVHGFVGFDELPKALVATAGGTSLLEEMPGDSIVAIGGNDFGGMLKSNIDQAGDETADRVGQAEGLLGVTLDDLAESFDEEFAFAVSGSDEDVRGAGGTIGTEGPFGLLTSGLPVTLAFAGDGETADTLEELIGSSQLATGTPPEEGEVGEFSTSEVNIGGVELLTGTTDERSILTTDSGVLEEFGEGDTLGEHEGFTDAWKLAEGPDEVTSSIFVDVARGIAISGAEVADEDRIGSLVGWSEAADDDAEFDMFLHVKD